MIEHLVKTATCRVASGGASGTGWLIAKNRIITARHCVLPNLEKGETIDVFFQGSSGAKIAAQIVDESAEFDTCLLSFEFELDVSPLAISFSLPAEGEPWESFGYPNSKTEIGHRLTGKIAQVLDVPMLKIDLDLSVDSNVALIDYRGFSGAVVVCHANVVGIVRYRFDNTPAAISLSQLESFLTKNEIVLPPAAALTSHLPLADREDFPKLFEDKVRQRVGNYLFLEGAHGYGKSTFCERFQPGDKHLVCLGAYRLTESVNSLGANYRAQPQIFFDWLSIRISGRIVGKPPRKEDRTYPQLIKDTLSWLEELSKSCAKNGNLAVFFIDGLNEIPSTASLDELLGLLPARLPSHITIVLTAPNFEATSVALAGKVKTGDVFKLPPLSYSACYAFCQQTLKGKNNSATVIKRICEKANGHPLYLRYIVEYANHQEDANLDDFPILTGAIEEYYSGIWAKLIEDRDAVNFLALMARLRSGLALKDFSKVLNQSEQAQLVPVVSAIRHILANENGTTIYHASFAVFVVEKTKAVDQEIHRRLGEFCLGHPELSYCVLNLVFHLLCAKNTAVFERCDQAWFDQAVSLGIEPDVLIEDVNVVVKQAAEAASSVACIRIMLLAQRISFRYDTLFAQSARLVAEALIVLGKPSEALQHVLRHKTLIVNATEALKIAFLLHRHGFNDHSQSLLDLIEQRIFESYEIAPTLDDFLAICSLHIQTIFLHRMAGGRDGMNQLSAVLQMANRYCVAEFKEDATKQQDWMCPLEAESPTYFLTFRDHYADLKRIKQFAIAQNYDRGLSYERHLQSLCFALLNFEDKVINYNLPKARIVFPSIFQDLVTMMSVTNIKPALSTRVANALIRLGAPENVVSLFAGNKVSSNSALQVRAKNAVDVDHDALEELRCNLRVAAFMDPSLLPDQRIGGDWLALIEYRIEALHCLDGKARRAKSSLDAVAIDALRAELKEKVISPLCFSLEQRVAWVNSYAIPENVLPSIYGQLSELLFDCFPDELPVWLDDLTERMDGQWGMFTEGFRASAFQIIECLVREKSGEALQMRLVRLLEALRNHVLRGVENRHELVPDILRMIPLFAMLGAKESAEALYQKLLSVSMGPSWYKEDQLGLMTETLKCLPVSCDVNNLLPKIARCLEKASGEMTFQRYVRAPKGSLLGQLARRENFRAAFAYFRHQCCGSLEELWNEAQKGNVDKVGPLKGSRFPGGALDDQSAVLKLVNNTKSVPCAYSGQEKPPFRTMRSQQKLAEQTC